jgi:hypothetical protein
MDPGVVYIPRCIQNGSESLGLKALEDFDVKLEAVPHSLNAISPYAFEYCFVEKEFVFYC